MRADDTAERVLDAAEQRFRRYGFHGTSFRELAADVGIKSASVHYHFPTKADLGRAVAARYTERFVAALGDPADPTSDGETKVRALVTIFRRAAAGDQGMCLCGLLGTEADGLPREVAASVADFFRALIDWLAMALGGDAPARARAIHVAALLEGALLVAHVLRDVAVFDAAVAPLLPDAG